jgi:hypothetical protein
MQEDDANVEALTVKHVWQDLNSVPAPSIAIPKQWLTSNRKRHHLSAASPTHGRGLDLDVDFDEVPKSKQTRAKAKKGKDGKLAPKPRPVTKRKNKKQDEHIEAGQRKANWEAEDGDKTLVEQVERSHQVSSFVYDWRTLI